MTHFHHNQRTVLILYVNENTVPRFIREMPSDGFSPLAYIYKDGSPLLLTAHKERQNILLRW